MTSNYNKMEYCLSKGFELLFAQTDLAVTDYSFFPNVVALNKINSSSPMVIPDNQYYSIYKFIPLSFQLWPIHLQYFNS